MDTASSPLPAFSSLVFLLLFLLTAGTSTAVGGEATADASVEFAPCISSGGGCLRNAPKRDGPSQNHPFLSPERIQTSVTLAQDPAHRPCTQDEEHQVVCNNGDVCRALKDGKLTCIPPHQTGPLRERRQTRVRKKNRKSHRLPCTVEEEREAACMNGYCYALDLGDMRYPSCQSWPNMGHTTPSPRSHRLPCTRAEKRETACLNGFCYALDLGDMRWPSCQCIDIKWQGKRCEQLSLDYYLNYRAELKKTAIISGVVIVLIIIVVSISVYFSYRRGKKKRAEAAQNKASEELAKSEPPKPEPESEPMMSNGDVDSAV